MHFFIYNVICLIKMLRCFRMFFVKKKEQKSNHYSGLLCGYVYWQIALTASEYILWWLPKKKMVVEGSTYYFRVSVLLDSLKMKKEMRGLENLEKYNPKPAGKRLTHPAALRPVFWELQWHRVAPWLGTFQPSVPPSSRGAGWWCPPTRPSGGSCCPS